MSIDSKKIAKNTILLYIRMLVLLVVSLYTSRILLKVIGIEDYGIYNLIAGFVTFLTFISNALVSSMQRYFNVALGQKDLQNYKEVYSMSLNIIAIFSCLILLLGETIGLWFVMNHLNIPADRYNAAICVYHISLLTFIANTIRTPFHASIIAHEKMAFYAYISLFEAIARLGMIFLLIKIKGDHLVIYAVLYLLIIIIIDLIYFFYCKRQFKECKYNYKKNVILFKDLISFSGWALMGQAAVVVKNQGESIFINRFFNVAVNAAMGVASQVANALEMFVINFQTAFKPQLIQSYASKDIDAHKKFLFRTSRFSYFLLLLIFVPVVTNIDFILNLWLIEIPQYTDKFIIYMLIAYLFSALSNPFVTSLFASGNIKYYQITLMIIFLCSLLIVFIAFCFNAKPYTVSIVAIGTQIASLISRLYFTHKYIGISYIQFLFDVFIPIIIVTLLSLILPYLLQSWTSSIIQIILSMIIEVLYTGGLILLIGTNRQERHYILNILKQKIK